MRKLRLRGKTFGPLKVIQPWGYTNDRKANLAWAYFCRACGRVGQRLGTVLVRQGSATACPGCGAQGRIYQAEHDAPDEEALEALLESAPVKPGTRVAQKGRLARAEDRVRQLAAALRAVLDHPLSGARRAVAADVLREIEGGDAA